MASNEVVIKVKSDNDTGPGFAAAKKDADKLGKDIVDVGKKAGKEVAEIGPKMGADLASGMGKGLGPIGPQLMAVLGVAGAAAAPMLGAVVSAAIVGGAAGVGVIGGLALVSKDPRVVSAGKSLGDELMKGLEDKAKVFVEPALAGINKLRVGFQEIGPDLDKIFKSSARYVEPLVDGLVSGSKKAIGGIATAISRAGPIVESFSRMFDEVGEAVGDAFETLSEDPETAARAFDELTDAVTATIGAVADFVNLLTKVYAGLGKTDEAIDSARFKMEDLWFKLSDGKVPLDLTADGMSVVERRAKDLAEANGELADSSEESAAATREQSNSLKELADELRAQTEPVFALLKAETDLGEARTKYNKAVVKYGENSAEARDELNNMARAAIELQGAVGELGEEFDGKVSPALRRTLVTAGWTSAEINALEREFKETKKAGDAFSKTYRAKVVTEYISVYSSKVTSAAEKAYQDTKRGRAGGGIVGSASGRTMGDDGMTWVGERGPELLELPVGSTVRSSGDSMRMMAAGQRAAGMGGGEKMTLRAQLDPTLDRTLVGLLISALRLEIGAGSGDVQTELGRN